MRWVKRASEVQMDSKLDAGKKRSQTGNWGCEGTRYERLGSPSSSQEQEETPGLAVADSVMRANGDEEMIITSIRATGIAAGLRYVPVGSYAAVHHSGLEWRTENTPLSVNHDVTEWTGPIPLPSDLSATLRIEVYSSFELQPMLGAGEQLRNLSVSVEQLLNPGAKAALFTFFSEAGDVVSPCSAISITIKQQKCEGSHSSMSMVRRVQRPTTASSRELENATNRGHSALLRYRRHGERWDLERSIESFEHALRICPPGHPCRAAVQLNLATVKFILFRVRRIDSSFEIPLNLYLDALSARPVGHVDRPSTLVHLAAVHFARAEMLKSEVDGRRAEALLHEVMQLCSAESYQNQAAKFLLQLHGTSRTNFQRHEPVVHDLPSHLTGEDLAILSVRLLDRFQQFGDLADLQQAIIILEQLVRSTSARDGRHRPALTALGSALSLRFECLGQLSDLENSISMFRKAVELTPDGHPFKPPRLNSLGISLLVRFLHLGEMDDLNGALSVQRRAIALIPHNDPDRHGYLHGLGNILRTRFEYLGQVADLEESISVLTDAVDCTPHGHPEKPDHLNNLGVSFHTRFKHFGKLGDLENAVMRQRNAVDLTPHDHPHKFVNLNNLGNSLLARFERLGRPGDLEDAISTQRDAAIVVPDDHSDKPACLSNLGNSLRTRFELLGEPGNLDDAISKLGDAVSLVPDGHPSRPGYLNNLANCFFTRFVRFGELQDLEVAISMRRNVVILTPHDNPRRACYLNNLGTSFRTRFEHLGQLSDLEEAISTLKDAIKLTPDGHTDRPDYLSHLGASFFTRFECLGEPHDLIDATLTLRAAVNLAPHDHTHKPGYLNNLGYSLKIQFDCFGELRDIEDSISRQRDAVNLTPQGHSEKPRHLNNFGISFITRFKCLGELSDLEQAISILREAIDLTPGSHPEKPPRLSNLGDFLTIRFERLGQLSDLEEAISIQKDAIGLTPYGHADKPRRLFHLGHSLVTRFKERGDLKDLEHAVSVYSHAASVPVGSIRDRFDASRKWISCARRMRHHSLLHAYSIAISLLPQLPWTGLSLEHRYAELIRGANLVQEAAAAALDAGFIEIAVEWLERGRSIVWGELLQLRSPYEELSSAHPDHARRLHELSLALEQASIAHERSLSAFSEQIKGMDAGVTDASSFSMLLRQRVSLEQDADKHRTLAINRDKLLQEIRRLPGFERFLLQKPFSQLRASAHAGPVVILNAAERCDALILLADVDHVIHVPLPKFTFKRSSGLQNMLEKLLGHARTVPIDERVGKTATRGGISWESLLSTLWKEVVNPVLDALAFSPTGELSRIFWCPTGPFTFLPIHAAGLYDTQNSHPGHKVFDFVVSSYTPTLSVLAPFPNLTIVPSDNLRVLAVRQPSSDGLSRLPGVNTEMEWIKAVIRSSSANTTLVESSIGTVEEVFGLLKEADWCHFACHGIQDGVDSGLCLADKRRLRVRDITALSRPRGGLAFLSACQTAMGDEHLSDEAIHIAAGLLYAGYGGVIGTMWSISDKLAPEVARAVYARLFRNCTRPDYREAARALHEAIELVRDDGGASFVTWIPFIHVGL